VRSIIGILTIFFLASTSILIPVAAKPTGSDAGSASVPLDETAPAAINGYTEDYVFVGGQNGSWFQPGQFPLLYQISLQNYSRIRLDPVSSGGTVWGGGFNGSQLLVSGWGSDDDSPGPYIWLYNGAHVVTSGSLDNYGKASSWSGGDIFSASYNGKEWLLSGLGSGPLPPYSDEAINHMSLGTFNGSTFTDLSSLVPEQQDAILYANAWNGQYWLVGGGYLGVDVLFTFNGSTIIDLTEEAMKAIPSMGSVQSIAWNGDYWLIGGIGFLAKYDGHNFVDLTQQLERALPTYDFNSVNAIAWNGQSWLIGGGTVIAQLYPSQAWFIAYTSNGFIDPSHTVPSDVSNPYGSSILAITAVNGVWFLGGYSSNKGMLLAYNDGILTDYSNLVNGFSYVDWVSNLQVLAFGKGDGLPHLVPMGQ
jgi:hypothetical protein